MFRFARLFAGATCASLLAGAYAQPKAERVDVGKREFEWKCVSCHGVSGKGNGIMAPFLTKSPPDLTQLAKNNGGVLPMARMYEIIDGEGVPSHGSREMPVWGLEYRSEAAESYGGMPWNSEAHVRARILALIEYINRIQVK